MNEVKIKIGEMWYCRGNQSPRWYARISRLDGSMGGLSEAVPVEFWPVFEHLAETQSRLEQAEARVRELEMEFRETQSRRGNAAERKS